MCLTLPPVGRVDLLAASALNESLSNTHFMSPYHLRSHASVAISHFHLHTVHMCTVKYPKIWVMYPICSADHTTWIRRLYHSDRSRRRCSDQRPDFATRISVESADCRTMYTVDTWISLTIWGDCLCARYCCFQYTSCNVSFQRRPSEMGRDIELTHLARIHVVCWVAL